MSLNKDNYCVIMAGGIGSRFWPMSRTKNPKQFHDVLGVGRTLIQLTYDRLIKIAPKENILIVTNSMYKDQVMEQLPDLEENQILLEPSRRNTAPCLAYAMHKIKAQNPNAAMIVAPSDHLILKEDIFINLLETALKQTRKNNSLVTLGIKPSRPDTGYGYIQFEDAEGTINKEVKKVKTFTEKPSLEIAEQFLDSGDFYWNSGIFIWTVEAINTAFENHLSEVNNLFLEGADKYNTPEEQDFIEATYAVCKNISIDYGIMEKAKNVFVVLGDFGWSDLGTWGSLYTHIDKDEKVNAIVGGKKVMLYESSNNMIKVPDDKTIVLQGLNDYIVVDTGDVLLVCQKQEEQRIKEFVNDIKLLKKVKVKS